MQGRRIIAGCAATLLLCMAGLRGAGKSDVADAVMRGDKTTVRALLEQKADVNGAQVDGATALHWAVYRDDVDTADLLIRAGANVKAANREGVTPLAMASLYGNGPIIDKLLKAGADAKERGPNGQTPLMLAARNGNPSAIELLIAAGADVNAKETLRGTTALMWAADQKHPGAVRALLDGGADFSARSGPAGLPRNYMANRVNTAVVQAAARRFAAAAAAGRTYAEQLAFEQRGGTGGGASLGGSAAGAEGAGRGQVGQNGRPRPADAPRAAARPAEAAPAAEAGGQAGAGQGRGTQGGRRGQAAGATQAAGSPDDGGDDSEVVVAGLVGGGGGGLTALVLAAREGDLESANLLLDAGADVNQVTEYGWTPLLTATNNRHYRLGSMLIDWGADVNIANKGGWTPLYLATDNRNIEGGDYPVPKADMDHLEYITALLDHGANPNGRARDNTLSRTIFTMQWFFESGATPFVRASQSSDTALMKLLLAYGADPKIPTDYGDTALTTAAGIGWVEGVTYEHSVKANVEAVKMLLDLGLDPNAANADGRTPLMGAAMKGRNDVILLLVERGARLDTRDRGSRDTDKTGSQLAGHTWEALDYADGLVRVGVQSAVNHPETASLIRKLMTDRGLPVPPPNRVVESICIVELCKERVWDK
jgi:ankyrin repeat protein